MKQIIEQLLKARLQYLINGNDETNWRDAGGFEVIERKRRLFQKRGVHIVKANIEAAVKEHWLDEDGASHVNYQTHTAYLCKDGDDMYMEEHMEDRNALLYDQMVIKDSEARVRPHSLILSLKTAMKRCANCWEGRSAMTGLPRCAMLKRIGINEILLIKTLKTIAQTLFPSA